MAGTGTKRIIELTEASTIQSGDYIAIDSNARGTKKVSTDTLATSAALTAETNARAGADEQMSERMDGIEEQTALIQNPTKTLSGALAHFTDGADMPMVACTAEIVPKQSGTGTPSPDNVRQISGWESVNIDVSGINVWDEEWESGGLNPSTGQTTSDSNRIRSKNPIKVNPSTSYYAYVGGMSSNDFRIYYYDVSNNFISVGSWQYSDTFTTPSNCYYIKFVRVNTNTYNNDISINYPSTDTDYHAYNGTTTTTDLGRTVYGGTLDVVSGVLTVDRAMVDLGTLTYTRNESSAQGIYYFVTPSNSILNMKTYGNNVRWSLTSERYAIVPSGQIYYGTTDDGSLGGWDGKGVRIRDDSCTSSSELVAALNGSKLVYELATPQTYQLTPTEVKTLLGENNVWADSGDVEITYRRDISIVLENLENALNGSNSLNTMTMSAPAENTAEEPTEDEAEDDMR